MLYDVALVTDTGDAWVVDTVTKSDLIRTYPGQNFLNLSSRTAELIKEEMINGKRVLIPKTVRGEVNQADFIVEEVDELEFAKNVAITEISNIVNDKFNTLSMLEFFNFITINNIFIEKGIVITEENREEKYLEVINTEDQNLIENLEKYLEAKDHISSVYWFFDKFRNFKKELKNLETVEEVNTLKNQTLATLRNP